VVAGSTVLPLPAMAQGAWLLGEWCADNGERMLVERSGPGFNEHTICTWVDRPPAGERIDVRVACANVHGDGVRVDERTVRYRAVKTGPRSASVRVGAGSAMAFARC
jgi:hypothetical protein